MACLHAWLLFGYDTDGKIVLYGCSQSDTSRYWPSPRSLTPRFLSQGVYASKGQCHSWHSHIDLYVHTHIHTHTHTHTHTRAHTHTHTHNTTQHNTTQHNQMFFRETMAVCLWPAYMHGCYFGMIRMAKLSPEYCGVQHGALLSF